MVDVFVGHIVAKNLVTVLYIHVHIIYVHVHNYGAYIQLVYRSYILATTHSMQCQYISAWSPSCS